MSKTMTSTTKSLIQLAQTIHTKDTITIQINNEFLNHNFSMIKQCLLRVQQLQNDMGKQKAFQQNINTKFSTLENRIKQNQKVQSQHDNKIKQLQNNIGDDFMKKLYDIQTKTKNTYDFEQTVHRLQKLNKFALISNINDQQKYISEISSQINKLKQQLNRYVQNVPFQKYQQSQAQQIQSLRSQINQLNIQNSSMNQTISNIQQNCNTACDQVKQNSKMLKQINFSQMIDKLKKFKQDMDHKVGELSIKLKKKCGMSDLNDLENNIIEKLDKFLLANEKNKASMNQTKDALVYLEKRVNQIYEIIVTKEGQQQNDALFSAKKIHCASCTKDLGKFEGKLGQYRPWAVFPCKQLDPQKTGGYGYLTYVDKMHYRRGSVVDDTSLDRLNKTFYQRSRQQQSPRKMNTTRTTNFMSSFGQQAKQIISLKQEYFKDLKSDKTGTKFFRVKKDIGKPSTAVQTVKQKAKEI